MFLIIKAIASITTILSFITAQSGHQSLEVHDDDAPLIDPLELILNATDKEGVFYCNSGVNISQQRSQLVASIDNRTSNSPTFLLRTKQINQTTIRIVVIPNGYIGINRISCHWENNITYGQTADLIIGSNPGVIILKEPCRAYDRRYVECLLDAPIIARAFEHGFPRHYSFIETTHGTPSYRYPPKLVSIINASKLVFHFEPLDRNEIPVQVPVRVNMTLSRFNSSIYQFNIKPIHTTKVNFQVTDVSNKKLTIRIDHNDTGSNTQRLCVGHVSQIDGQKALIAVQDIPETVEQRISIDSLREGTKYKICLRCFYERTDESFNHDECRNIETLAGGTPWIMLLVILIVIVITIVPISLGIKSASLRSKCCSSKSSKSNESNETANFLGNDPARNHYQDEQPSLPMKQSDSAQYIEAFPDKAEDSDDEDPSSAKYQSFQMREIMQRMTDKHKPSPDTIDLSSQENIC